MVSLQGLDILSKEPKGVDSIDLSFLSFGASLSASLMFANVLVIILE